MGNSELTKITLKIAFTVGFILHVLSIITRIYLFIYGPPQFITLLPYMIMEWMFLTKSIHAIYVTPSKNGTTWLKTFAIINVFLILLLFIASILFEILLKGNTKDSNLPPTFNVVKVVWIIFLSGPLITNSAFLGVAYLSTTIKIKDIPNIPWSYHYQDWHRYKISDKSLSSKSTDEPTQYSLLSNE